MFHGAGRFQFTWAGYRVMGTVGKPSVASKEVIIKESSLFLKEASYCVCFDSSSIPRFIIFSVALFFSDVLCVILHRISMRADIHNNGRARVRIRSISLTTSSVWDCSFLVGKQRGGSQHSSIRRRRNKRGPCSPVTGYCVPLAAFASVCTRRFYSVGRACFFISEAAFFSTPDF